MKKGFLAVFFALVLLSPMVAEAALSTGAVASYKFDESSGTAADSASTNTLTNVNTATFSAGKINNATNLASASLQEFNILDASQTGLDVAGTFTIACWIKLNTRNQYNSIITKTDTAFGTQIQYIFVLDNTNRMTIDLSDNGGQTAGHFVRYAGNLNQFTATGVYHFVAVTGTMATQSIQFYWDGVATTTTQTFGTTIGPTLFNGIGLFRVGNTGGYWAASDYMDGQMDNCTVWNTAKTSGEMLQLFNSNVGTQYPFAVATPYPSWQLGDF